jgi:hypothetical protein
VDTTNYLVTGATNNSMLSSLLFNRMNTMSDRPGNPASQTSESDTLSNSEPNSMTVNSSTIHGNVNKKPLTHLSAFLQASSPR